MFDDRPGQAYTSCMISRDSILEDMHEAQRSSGRWWISPEALERIGQRHRLSLAAVRGIATYYTMFSLEPRGRHHVRLCVSPVCRMLGSLDLLGILRDELGIGPGETDPRGLFSLETVQCLGRCAGAPAMMVDDRVYGSLDPGSVRSILDMYREGREDDPSGSALPAARRFARHIGPGSDPLQGGTDVHERYGCGDPGEDGGEAQVSGIRPDLPGSIPAPATSPPIAPATATGTEPTPSSGATRPVLRYPRLADPADPGEYVRAGGYRALSLALGTPGDELVGELVRSGLRGRGGAGYPTGAKERSSASGACPEEPECERFVICNADEGEPGTFKDRILMEREPHLVIEGMAISARAIGASRGFLYIRGEYGEAIGTMRRAVAAAGCGGYLGTDILGSGFSFDIAIRRGAGSYLCGEESTLIESLEGKRGQPRIKPPYPAERGYRGMPTLVNNVETLAAVPWIVEHGADAWLARGSSGSPGTKLFCVSGDVARPGYGEWDMGVELGTVIRAAGGVVDASGKPADAPIAVLLGGAAGAFVPGDALSLRLDYDAPKAAGAVLGSGAVIVIGPGRSIPGILLSILEFFEHESCGTCVPCRVGTAGLVEKARRLVAADTDAAGRRAILAGMVDDATRMARTSLCPLGQSPAIPLASALGNLAPLV